MPFRHEPFRRLNQFVTTCYSVRQCHQIKSANTRTPTQSRLHPKHHFPPQPRDNQHQKKVDNGHPSPPHRPTAPPPESPPTACTNGQSTQETVGTGSSRVDLDRRGAFRSRAAVGGQQSGDFTAGYRPKRPGSLSKTTLNVIEKDAERLTDPEGVRLTG